jgi:hypothetical protein
MLKTKFTRRVSYLAALTAAALSVGTSKADMLLHVDLSVVNQLTIRATTGTSAVTASVDDFTGFILVDFAGFGLGDSTASTLVDSNGTSDGAVSTFRAGGGFLNLFDMATSDLPPDLLQFTDGSQAFTGEATWTVSLSQYNTWKNGPKSGDIVLTDGLEGNPSLQDAPVVGTWSLDPPSTSVPDTSSTLALLALGICCLASVRYKHKAEANA